MSQALQTALQALQAEYADACAARDQVNALNAPIEAQLADVNAQIEALRVRQAELSAQIDANRGGEAWFAVKRRVGQLANSIMEVRKGLK